MSNLKCPVCGEKIEHIKDGWCNCKNRCTGSGSIDLWLNFIRTRKALDVAVDALKNIFDYSKIVSSELQKNHLSLFQTPINKMQYSAQQALKQITALEQKDVK